MTRNKKLKLNTVTSLINQCVVLICGFILPRYILNFYGSNVNGLISSIQQLLGLISFCELGVGAVVQSALYRPLAENDNSSISKILVSAKKFFDKIGIILTVYVFILAVVFPISQIAQFDYIYTLLLIVSMSISYFAQYFFGIRNQLLENADQRAYVQLFYQSLTVILNTFLSVLLIKHGATIQVVKFTSSLVFLIRPIGMAIDVKKHYSINYKLQLTEEPIKQKWNGLAQHFATVVLQNTDTVILTFFSTLTNVSIYNVYHLVVNGVKQIVTSMTTGIQSLFGNMIAKNETNLLTNTFNCIEWLLHTITVLIFTITGILIVPFIKVYTNGITDADYIVPAFAILITCATAAYCLRLPYNMIVLAAGHYKQTQLSAIIEMTLNIVISVALVFWFGLVGVAVGTLISMSYRTVYFAVYLRKNILGRKLIFFLKHIFVDILCVCCMVASTYWIKLSTVSYFSWFIMALECSCICLFITILVNVIFYRKDIGNTIKLFFRNRRKTAKE